MWGTSSMFRVEPIPPVLAAQSQPLDQQGISSFDYFLHPTSNKKWGLYQGEGIPTGAMFSPGPKGHFVGLGRCPQWAIRSCCPWYAKQWVWWQSFLEIPTLCQAHTSPASTEALQGWRCSLSFTGEEAKAQRSHLSKVGEWHQDWIQIYLGPSPFLSHCPTPHKWHDNDK